MSVTDELDSFQNVLTYHLMSRKIFFSRNEAVPFNLQTSVSVRKEDLFFESNRTSSLLRRYIVREMNLNYKEDWSV